MKLNILKLSLLLTVAGMEAGCASSGDHADDSSTPSMEAVQSSEPVPAHDESHGWGANIQNMNQQGSPNR